jgi:hypothetical protein
MVELISERQRFDDLWQNDIFSNCREILRALPKKYERLQCWYYWREGFIYDIRYSYGICGEIYIRNLMKTVAITILRDLRKCCCGPGALIYICVCVCVCVWCVSDSVRVWDCGCECECASECVCVCVNFYTDWSRHSESNKDIYRIPYTDTQTHKEQDNFISLILSLRNKESSLKRRENVEFKGTWTEIYTNTTWINERC